MKLLLFSILTLTSFSALAQDSTMVEQYCEVVATGRVLTNKVTIAIDYGKQRSAWKDNRLHTDKGKLQKFNSVIDAINYMGRDGWKLVNAFPISEDNGLQVYHYLFKKEFPESQTE